VTVAYTDVRLPYTDYSSREISRIWGAWFKQTYPDLTHVCTSEPYGDYLAEYMQVIHLPFDPGRVRQPISARQIRMDPMQYWEYLPTAVRPHYVRKVCIYGPESTGKSTLAARLAAHFDTVHVPEMARDLIPDSTECTWDDLERVVTAQTEAVERLARQARRVLICDTDLLTTQVYARYLFQRELQVTPEQDALHQYHLYLVPDTDVPYVQDGTRLGAHTREEMKTQFLQALQLKQTPWHLIRGNWETRFRQAVAYVEELLHKPVADLLRP
jgi:HTH-type transcriptional repressor of NAD biosynthesis genes